MGSSPNWGSPPCGVGRARAGPARLDQAGPGQPGQAGRARPAGLGRAGPGQVGTVWSSIWDPFPEAKMEVDLGAISGGPNHPVFIVFTLRKLGPFTGLEWALNGL